MSKRKSRLSLKTERRTRKTILLTSLGILIILILLIKFGVSLLVGFSVFLAGTKNQTSTNTRSSGDTFIAAPVLNPLPSATNSAVIVISGRSESNKTVAIFVNNDLKDTTQTDKNGNFSFTQNLSAGGNLIEAKVKQNNKSSDFSNSFIVFLKNSAPSLTVDSPSDGQSFSKDQNTVNVTGKTDANTSVTVNGFWAIINESNTYSYNLPLQNGDNQIEVIAIDSAGNKTEKNLKVTYSQ